MTIGNYTPIKQYDDNLLWTQSRLDALVNGIDTFIEEELEAKAPDKAGTETISGRWTLTKGSTFSANNVFSGNNLLIGVNTLQGTNSITGALDFKSTNNLLIPLAKPTTDLCIGIDTNVEDRLWYQDNSVQLAPSVNFPAYHVVLHEDFVINGYTGPIGDFGLIATNSGTGSGAQDTVASSSYFGVIAMFTGSTSAGKVGLLSNPVGIIMDSDTIFTYKAYINIPTLSDATDTFNIDIGLLDEVAGSIAEGVYFSYSHGLNSGNWTCVTEDSNTATSQDSGVAVTTADTLLTATFDGTTVTFYVDGVSVATSITNIPVLPSATGVGCGIVKSVGTASRHLYVDFINLEYTFGTTTNSGRPFDVTLLV